MRWFLVVSGLCCALGCGGFAGQVEEQALKQTLAKMHEALEKLPDAAAKDRLRPVLQRIKRAADGGNIDLVEVVELGLAVDGATTDGQITDEELAALLAKVDEFTK